MQPETRRVLYTTHSWMGAIFGIMLFIVCFSGSWAVVSEELRFWEARDARLSPVDDFDVDDVLASAQRAGLDTRNATITLPSALQRHVKVSPGGRGRSEPRKSLVLEPSTARVVQPAVSQMADIVTTLHKSLYAGFPGRIVVSLFGVAMTVLLLGGIAMHARRWRDSLTLKTGRGWRSLTTDAHKVIGFWLLPLLLLISVTGIFSGLGALGTMTLSGFAYPGGMREAMGELTGRPGVAASGHAAPMPGVRILLERHRQAHPEFRPENVTLSHWGDANATLTVAGTRAGQLSTAVFEKYRYRAADGELLHADSAHGRGFWTQAFVAIQPLHFAQYGGAIVTLLNFLGGVGAAVLAASGTVMWLERRRLRGIAGRGTEILRAMALGLCGGLLVATSALMLGTAVIPPFYASKSSIQQCLFWGTWALMLALPVWAPWRHRGVQPIAALAGLCFTLTGLLDIARSSGESWALAGPAWVVDAGVIFMGVGLCVLALRLQRKTL